MTGSDLPPAEDFAAFLRSRPADEVIEKFRRAAASPPRPSTEGIALSRVEIMERYDGTDLTEAINKLVQSAASRIYLFSRRCILMTGPLGGSQLQAAFERERRHHAILEEAAQHAASGRIAFDCAVIPPVLRKMAQHQPSLSDRLLHNLKRMTPWLRPVETPTRPAQGFRIWVTKEDLDPLYSFIVVDNNVAFWLEDPTTGDKQGYVSRDSPMSELLVGIFKARTIEKHPQQIMECLAP